MQLPRLAVRYVNYSCIRRLKVKDFYHYLNFILHHPTLFYMLHYFGGLIRGNGIARSGMWYVWGGRGETEINTGIWPGLLKEGASFKDLGTDGRILCTQIFRKQDVRAQTAQLGSGHRQMECHCTQGNELSGSTKRRQFLDWLRYISITRTPLYELFWYYKLRLNICAIYFCTLQQLRIWYGMQLEI